LVFANSPALTTPNLGTPSAATLTNATGLPVATGISGLGTGVATFLATPSSANLRTAVTDETGTGALVFATSPTLVTPVLGVATATSVQGIIGNVTPAAGTFTTLTANGNTTLGDAAGDITTVPDLKALQVTSADRHSVRPSLLLDFANTKTLDPRITFTRASTGTFYDGKTVAKAEENLFLQSEAFNEAAWTKVASSVTANTETSPNGTTTGDTLTATSGTGGKYIQGTRSVFSGTVIMSFYVKAGTHNYVQFINTGDGQAFANFDITSGSGVVGTTGTKTTSFIVDAGNGWYRCIAVFNPTVVYTAEYRVYLVPSASATYAQALVAVGTETIILWGAQLEQRSSVTAYTATTTAPITNYIPALQSAASGVARFEHNPITGESLGLEIEEQRTNLVTYSDDFDNAAWTKTRTSVTSNAIVAPDGTLTGDKLVEDTSADTTHIVTRSVSLGGSVDSSTYSISIFAKAGERTRILMLDSNQTTTGNTTFNLSAGTVVSGTGSISSVGNGWYRCTIFPVKNASVTSALAVRLDNGATSAYTGDGYSGAYIWGAQLEAGPFVTSYIPTVASQVTRSVDSAVMTGTNFSSWFNNAESTIYAQAITLGTAVAGVFAVHDGTANNKIDYRALQGLVVITKNGTDAATPAVGAFVAGQSSKVALATKQGSHASQRTGGTIQTAASQLMPPSNLNTLTIGALQQGFPLNGTMSKLAIYPLRLTNAEVTSLVTI
jgi:hypothetical protein